MSVRKLNLSQAEYFKYPAFSKTLALKLLNTSPAHAIIPEPPTDEMNRGVILHALILGKGAERIAVAPQFETEKGTPSDNWATKQAKAFKADAKEKGLTPVLKGEYEELSEVAEILREKITSLVRDHLQKDFADGTPEEQWTWDDDGVKCKGMLDWRDEADIIDLKISYTANPELLPKIAYNGGWDIQESAYCKAVEMIDPAFEGRSTFTFIVCEPEPPYSVVLATLDGTLSLMGKHRWEQARDIYKTCKETGEWPSYPAIARISGEKYMWIMKEAIEKGWLEDGII